jgi:hypothetical protein
MVLGPFGLYVVLSYAWQGEPSWLILLFDVSVGRLSRAWYCCWPV